MYNTFVNETLQSMKRILLLLSLISCLGYSQSITGDLKNAVFRSCNGYFYIYNLESNKIFHIRKYNKEFDLVASYDKKLEDKVYDGSYAVKFQESEIFIKFQTGKFKMGLRPKPVPGFKLIISYDLKEIESEKLESIGGMVYLESHYTQYNSVQEENGTNSFNNDDFEKEVLKKHDIKEIGPLVSMQNDNKTQTFQIANYNDVEGKYKYNGFYVLTEAGNKAIKFKKYAFLDFEELNKEKSTFMQFYPNLVKNNRNSFLIPFAQKVYRKESICHGTGQNRFCSDVDVYYIVGTGVIELSKVDGTIKTKIFDRKGITKKLKEETIAGFEGASIDEYYLLTRNWPTALNVFKNTCWTLYTNEGEKFQECDKGTIYEFANTDYFVKFEPGKDGFSLTKVKYK